MRLACIACATLASALALAAPSAVRAEDKPVSFVNEVAPIVNAIAFTPDGKGLVAGGQHELTVWGIADGKLQKRIRTRAERAYGMVFVPDGKLVVAGARPGQEGDVRVYDINGPGESQNGVAVLD